MLSAIRLSDLPSYQAGKQAGLQEGIEQGLEQGLERGLEQGLDSSRRLLLVLLHKKFGILPQHTQQRIQQATTEELMQWTEKFVHANTLEEIFNLK